MKKNGAKPMGRFSVEIELANYDDVVLEQHGQIDPSAVRRVRIEGLVDTGATRLVLPARVVRALGLRESGRIGVRYADGRQATRDLVEAVQLRLLGRSSVFNASVEPRRSAALIGGIVLEDLDFVVDPTLQRLVPRDPNMIISEAE